MNERMDDLTEAQLRELRELLEKTLQEVEQDLATSTSDAKPVAETPSCRECQSGAGG